MAGAAVAAVENAVDAVSGEPADEPGRLRRIADKLHAPLWQEAKELVQQHEIRSHHLWQDPPLDAKGLPVLLVGGMGSTPRVLHPLQDLLLRYNCRPLIAPIKFGVGCGEATTLAVEQSLERLVDAVGEPAVVIAHSRGGQFSRAVAVRRPDRLHGLVTLGSPLNRMLAVHPLLRAEVAVLGLAGYLGMPGLLRPACLWGKCCAALRRDLSGPFPESVPFLSLYSREDKVVDWRACLDPAARLRHVSASHGGLLWAPNSLEAITDELAAIAQTAYGVHAPALLAVPEEAVSLDGGNTLAA